MWPMLLMVLIRGFYASFATPQEVGSRTKSRPRSCLRSVPFFRKVKEVRRVAKSFNQSRPLIAII